MALEWGALALAVAVEALLLVFVTLPGLQGFRRGVISVARSALQPLLAVIPFALFLLLDVYWKYENRLQCKNNSCTQVDRDHYTKSVMKSQRNGLLAISALLLYWVLYRVTHMLVDLEKVQSQVKMTRSD